MKQRYCGFLLLLGCGRTVVKVLAVGQALVLGSDSSFYVCKS